MAKRQKPSSRQVPQVSVTQPKLRIQEPAGGTFYFYSNLVQVTWSAVDVKIRFGELTKFDASETIVKEHAAASMAWAQAKTLMTFLQQAVAGYERLNGEIKIAPELKLPPGVPLTPAGN